jgi:hypothetical protein
MAHDEEMVPHAFTSRTPYEPGDDRDIWCKDCEYHRDHQIHSADVPWREGPAVCTNCGETAKPHPAYADFVGPFCEGCWDRLREYFTSGVICPVCKHEHDRETSDCQLDRPDGGLYERGFGYEG